MSEDSEKQRYSTSEMLKHLRSTQDVGGRKSPDSEETYDPETGMVTVRKRKRRRKPGGAVKNGMWVVEPWWLVLTKRLAFFGLPLVVLAVVVLYMVLAGAVQTDRFREGVEAGVARQWGLSESPAIDGIAMHGTRLSAKSATVMGAPGQAVKRAGFSDLDGKLTLASFTGGDWFLELLTVIRAELVLVPAAPDRQAEGSAGDGVPSGGGFLLAESPERFRLQDFTVSNLTVRFGEQDEGVQGPGLHNARGALSRREAPDGMICFDGQISGGGKGILRLPAWPDLKMDTARISIDRGQIRIAKAFFELGEAGVISVEGVVSLAPGGETRLDVSLENILLDHLLDSASAKRLVFGDGVMEAKNLELTWNNDDPAGTWKLAGPVNVRLLRVKALPFLEGMEQILENDLQSTEFNRAGFTMELTPEYVRLGDLDLSISQRLSINGGLVLEREGWVAAGELSVGAPPVAFLETPPSIFAAGDEGMVWTPIRLSGTLAGPRDDFNARMLSSRLGGDGSLGLPNEETDPVDRDPADDAGIDPLLEGLLREAVPRED